MYIPSETIPAPATRVQILGSTVSAVRSVVFSMPFLEATFFLAIIAAAA